MDRDGTERMAFTRPACYYPSPFAYPSPVCMVSTLSCGTSTNNSLYAPSYHGFCCAWTQRDGMPFFVCHKTSNFLFHFLWFLSIDFSILSPEGLHTRTDSRHLPLAKTLLLHCLHRRACMNGSPPRQTNFAFLPVDISLALHDISHYVCVLWCSLHPTRDFLGWFQPIWFTHLQCVCVCIICW